MSAFVVDSDTREGGHVTTDAIDRLADRLKTGPASRMAAARKQFCIAPRRVARRAGTSASALLEWEAGRRTLPLSTVTSIRAALTKEIVDHALEVAFALAPDDPRLARLRAIRIKPAAPLGRECDRGGMAVIDDETGEVIYGPR